MTKKLLLNVDENTYVPKNIFTHFIKQLGKKFKGFFKKSLIPPCLAFNKEEPGIHCHLLLAERAREENESEFFHPGYTYLPTTYKAKQYIPIYLPM